METESGCVGPTSEFGGSNGVCAAYRTEPIHSRGVKAKRKEQAGGGGTEGILPRDIEAGG